MGLYFYNARYYDANRGKVIAGAVLTVGVDLGFTDSSAPSVFGSCRLSDWFPTSDDYPQHVFPDIPAL